MDSSASPLGGAGSPHRSALGAAVCGARLFIARAIRAAKLLARDGRIPGPLRWIVVVGLLPLPGPVDEVILLLASALLFAFCREPMRDAWRRARTAHRADPS